MAAIEARSAGNRLGRQENALPHRYRPSRKSGEGLPWADRIMPYFEEVRLLPPSERRSYVRAVSLRTGIAENTLHRQLAALLFLESQGKDPKGLRPGVSLMAIETTAKIMGKNEKKGRALLDEALERRKTAQQLVDIYQDRFVERDSRGKSRRGGYKRGSDALASLYIEVAASAGSGSADRSDSLPADTVPHPKTAEPNQKTVSARPLTEIMVPMSLVAQRLVQALQARIDGPVEVRFNPGALTGAGMEGRVVPLLDVSSAKGVCAAALAYDGRLHGSQTAGYLAAAIGRALLAGTVVHAYVAEPDPQLLAELQDLVAQESRHLDVRRERIMIPGAASFFAQSLDSTARIPALFSR